MKRLEIIRVDPNTGYVVRLNKDFQRIKITEILPYRSCMAFVLEHQEEGTIYKIGKIGKRKDARRKLERRILAADDVEAINIFCKMDFDAGITYQLVTGDWRIVAQHDPDGKTMIMIQMKKQ